MNNNLDEYLNSTLLERSLSDFYSRNRIEFPKVEIYRNFTLFLNNKIQKTYVGDNFMNDSDRDNHFKWVWDSISLEFVEFGFDFKNNDELYKYMNNLFKDLFYDVDEKEDEYNKAFFKNIVVVIEGIFNYTVLKNPESLHIFLDIYKLFNNGRK